MEEKSVSRTVMVQAVKRPGRKLILLRSQKATEYWSYCEEKGCEWEGFYNSIAERLDYPAILELPNSLIKKGTSACASGIEVPLNYSKPLPEEYEIIELPPCEMLYFQGMPYGNEEELFCEALGIVQEAVNNYNPEKYGYRFAKAAPKFIFGTPGIEGAKIAISVCSK